MSNTLVIKDLGLQDYHTVWEAQKELQKKLIAGDSNDYLIICSHPEVITLGRSAKKENVLNSKNIEVLEIERGGDVTYHCPEQIILYPILNLNRYKRDVAWYLRQLEEVILQTLAHFELQAVTIPGKTGVWIDEDSKIASLGVRISRWCTLHGLSVNVLDCQSGFNSINPCGFTNIRSTSIHSELAKNNELEHDLYLEAKTVIIDNFCKTFNTND